MKQEEIKRQNKSGDLIYFCLLFCALALFQGELLLGKIPAGLDNCLFTIPRYSLGLLRPIALWNPFEFCGLPLLGNSQYAFLYPPRWLFHFIDAPKIYGSYIFLHYFFSGVGMFLLCRRIFRQPRVAAFLSAITWMCSSFLIGRVENVVIFFSTVWLPWVCWLTITALCHGNFKIAYLSAIALAVVFHIGSPQAFFYAFVVLCWSFLYVLLNPPADKKVSLQVRVKIFSFILIVFGGLIAPIFFRSWSI